MLTITEDFYKAPFSSQITKPENLNEVRKIINEKKNMYQLNNKHNQVSGEDGILTEMIKEVEQILVSKL